MMWEQNFEQNVTESAHQDWE